MPQRIQVVWVAAHLQHKSLRLEPIERAGHNRLERPLPERVVGVGRERDVD
jgi:hypothetical protein